jgi:hypothetical protein
VSEENGVSKIPLKDGQPKDPVQEQPQDEKIPAPSFGFTQEGTFRLEIDLRLGLMMVLAFLARGTSYINGAINQQEAKMREEMKQKSLLKPKVSNGLGKFFGLAK